MIYPDAFIKPMKSLDEFGKNWVMPMPTNVWNADIANMSVHRAT